MRGSRDEQNAMHFATQIFDLLDRASTTSTYKYAVLLGLLDCCQSGVRSDGTAPRVITTRQLAERVVEIYWPQSKPFEMTGEQLKQNNGGQARIITLIDEFRDGLAGSTSPYLGRLSSPDAYERLLDKVEWKLIKMPLPKLQRFGSTEHEFLYQIGWDDHVTKTASGYSDYRRGKPGNFDNRILLKPGVGSFLVRLGPLLRPLIQREWARTVAGFNRLPSDRLEAFLFNPSRQNLSTLVEPLAETQEGRCFYCRERLDRKGEVDHFIPWSRAPNDELHNLVLAHESCNRSKNNHLAEPTHLQSWRNRLSLDQLEGRRFQALTTELAWPRSAESSLSIARAVYFSVPEEMPLWSSTSKFVSADPALITSILG